MQTEQNHGSIKEKQKNPRRGRSSHLQRIALADWISTTRPTATKFKLDLIVFVLSKSSIKCRSKDESTIDCHCVRVLRSVECRRFHGVVIFAHVKLLHAAN